MSRDVLRAARSYRLSPSALFEHHVAFLEVGDEEPFFVHAPDACCDLVEHLAGAICDRFDIHLIADREMYSRTEPERYRLPPGFAWPTRKGTPPFSLPHQSTTFGNSSDLNLRHTYGSCRGEVARARLKARIDSEGSGGFKSPSLRQRVLRVSLLSGSSSLETTNCVRAKRIGRGRTTAAHPKTLDFSPLSEFLVGTGSARATSERRDRGGRVVLIHFCSDQQMYFHSGVDIEG
jgi:hypothetical protein